MICCLDGPAQEQRRTENYADHHAYLAEAGGGLIVAGPLLADDGSKPIGSLFLLEAASREAAETYIAADPFRARGVWGSVSVHRFDKRTDRRGTAGAA
jgi:uncharacterized protein YciI